MTSPATVLDWGLRQTDFEEILNDSSTNSLGANIINSSN